MRGLTNHFNGNDRNCKIASSVTLTSTQIKINNAHRCIKNAQIKIVNYYIYFRFIVRSRTNTPSFKRIEKGGRQKKCNVQSKDKNFYEVIGIV